MKKVTYILLYLLIFSFIVLSCTKQTVQPRTITADEIKSAVTNTGAEVTIMEFGSNCVPCVKMKIILDLLVENYGDILAVEFIDTGSDSGKKITEANKIRIIPSQIFLDSTGTEFFRHEGYLSQEELLSILKNRE